MKINIIGGGLYGTYISKALCEAGHSVIMYDSPPKHGVKSATEVNQFRIHGGAHYPRSPETVKEIQESLHEFEGEFCEGFIKNLNTFYCIRDDGYTSTKKYKHFLDLHRIANLKYENLDEVENVDSAFWVHEDILDKQYLQNWIYTQKKMLEYFYDFEIRNVDVSFDYMAYKGGEGDCVIYCGYDGALDYFGGQFGFNERYEIELCCKPVIIPMGDDREKFLKNSYIVMDGEFGCCINPIGNGYCSVGSVSDGVLWRGNFKPPETVIKNLMECNPTHTILDNLKGFFPTLDYCEPDSNFVWKIVKQDVEDTDERRTYVEQQDDWHFSVISGKLSTCVTAKNQVMEMLKNV